MLWCESAADGAPALEDLAAFVSQLAARGIAAGVEPSALPRGLPRNAQFDLAPFLRDGPPTPEDGLVVIAAERLDDSALGRFRRFAGVGRALAFGAYPNRQARTGAKARLSYALGIDPEVVDLAEAAPAPGFGTQMPVFGAAARAGGEERWRRADGGRLRVLLVAPDLDRRSEADAIAALGFSRRIAVAVLTDGRAKAAWQKVRGIEPPIFHYHEILPAALAARFDIAVIFGPVSSNYRLQCLVANLAVDGGVVIDGTEGHALAGCDATLRGPQHAGGLTEFLSETVIPNVASLGKAAAASDFAAQVRIGALGPLVALGMVDLDPEPPVRKGIGRRSRGKARPLGPRLIFMPTNGIGLGHAQRCSLIAGALDPSLGGPVFAAFPSCLGLIKGYGFDAMPLIARSAAHDQNFENDLANYLRLRALAREARGLVFDGGYVFDSVARTIVEARLPAVWIRRGLWQAGQDNAVSLDREKVFGRVIVPEEAFPELNRSYSRGDLVAPVGPVVQPLRLDAAARRQLRGKLEARFGLAFDRLVVTQLGAGVAADRAAQIQALCGMMDRRGTVLHLVVVWPTALVEPAWFRWRRTRVVRTHHVAVLAAAADLCVSAAGYNTFHEMLYNRLPSILLPQMSAFMDDQRARARAAEERGVATMVEAHELMALERAVARALDDGKGADQVARIAALDLPDPGTARAAALIEETIDGTIGLDRAPTAHRTAGA